jgi:hypothetical protein
VCRVGFARARMQRRENILSERERVTREKRQTHTNYIVVHVDDGKAHMVASNFSLVL